MNEEGRVLKSVNCQSLSGKSKLGYQFGVLNDTEPHIRISTNSGGGMFCKDWIPVAEILKVLKGAGVKDAIAATAFRGIFAGKSVNTLGFLMAILKNEGVIQPHAEKPRSYEVTEVGGFAARIEALMQPGLEKPEKGQAKVKPAAKRAVSKPKAPKD